MAQAWPNALDRSSLDDSTFRELLDFVTDDQLEAICQAAAAAYRENFDEAFERADFDGAWTAASSLEGACSLLRELNATRASNYHAA